MEWEYIKFLGSIAWSKIKEGAMRLLDPRINISIRDITVNNTIIHNHPSVPESKTLSSHKSFGGLVSHASIAEPQRGIPENLKLSFD